MIDRLVVIGLLAVLGLGCSAPIPPEPTDPPEPARSDPVNHETVFVAWSPTRDYRTVVVDRTGLVSGARVMARAGIPLDVEGEVMTSVHDEGRAIHVLWWGSPCQSEAKLLISGAEGSLDLQLARGEIKGDCEAIGVSRGVILPLHEPFAGSIEASIVGGN
jgi:hypothetical protein